MSQCLLQVIGSNQFQFKEASFFFPLQHALAFTSKLLYT